MNEFRYILEPYKGPASRYTCPKCEKKEFTRYIDTETGRHLAPHVGRCNRESSCGYHFTPKEYLSDKIEDCRIYPVKTAQQVSYVSSDILKSSLADYDHNNLYTFLSGLLGAEIATKLAHLYNIGTSRHWPGAVVYWQVDVIGRIRTGKIMLYDANTGKRVKQPYDHITWAHSVMKLKDFGLRQCLYGEHLLAEKKNTTVAIVESEKTAIIASAFMPQFTWLACGGLSNLTAERCGVLKGRTVILYPDAGCFEKWNTKAKELSKFCTCKASNIIEQSATEAQRLQGWDLADFLIAKNCKPIVPGVEDIRDYWSLTPKVLSHFSAHPEDRELFHREFCREYHAIDFTEFEKYSLSIN